MSDEENIRGRRRHVSRFLFSLIVIPIACGILATVLFFAQGGFGGGHGKYDQLIFLLCQPSVQIVGYLPRPGIFDSDLVALLCLPMLLNSALWLLPFFLWRFKLKIIPKR